jgi:hypothetical protein
MKVSKRAICCFTTKDRWKKDVLEPDAIPQHETCEPEDSVEAEAAKLTRRCRLNTPLFTGRVSRPKCVLTHVF